MAGKVYCFCPHGVLYKLLIDPAHRGFEAGTRRFQGGRRRMSEVALDFDNAQWQLLAGITAWSNGQRDQAFAHLQESVQINPHLARAHEWLGQWFLQEGMADDAMRHSTRAIALDPHDEGILISHARVLEVAGDLNGAWALVQRLVREGCSKPRLASLYGSMARSKPEAGTALDFVRHALNSPNLTPADLSGLHFAAAGLLDTVGSYDAAFSHAVHANRFAGPAEDPLIIERAVDELISYFMRQRLRNLPRATYRSDKPVFIVGMLRSGSSLLEQILSSHPMIHGAGELDFMYRIATGAMQMLRSGPNDYPRCLDRLTIDQADGLAQIYIDPLTALAPNAHRIIDKTLQNFLHLGLIAILLPESRIIHCKRDPLDNCLSCFMTQFTAGHEFSRNLASLGRYYPQYERLMTHWKETLDLPILDVQYEDVVNDLEGQTRRALDFLDLPWDEHCLKFHETRRPVATASVQQVRRSIYADSVGRWRRYERHLTGLRKSLDRVD
jgi:tetratricopeptide (TPR) repeat protein